VQAPSPAGSHISHNNADLMVVVLHYTCLSIRPTAAVCLRAFKSLIVSTGLSSREERDRVPEGVCWTCAVTRQKLKTPQQSQERVSREQPAPKQTESRTASMAASLPAQRLRGAYGAFTERVRTAYGSLAERLRNYRSPLERSRSGSTAGEAQ